MLVKRRHSRPIPEGATIFERDGKRHARWRTPTGQLKTRPLNRKGDRVVEQSDCWYIRIADPETGKLREWRGYTDRQASQAKEVEIVRRIERGEAGLTDPLAHHRRRPLKQHLLDYAQHLEGKGNTPDHVDKTVSRCQRVLYEIGATVVRELSGEAVEECLADLRREGMSLSTSNGYLRALRGFCNWMARIGRIHRSPLLGVSCQTVTDADRRRRRRALTDAELSALLDAARQTPDPVAGLSGEDRSMLYLLAASTGLRASELASLTPESFELDDASPAVRCLAGYTKNGREALQPLRRDVAKALRPWLAAKLTGERVWPGTWASERHGAEMMRTDLANADVAYQDARGRYADFHSLRHTFISNLARAGVHPRNAQALARHSTIELTMNVYTHVEMRELAADLESLPSMVGGGVTKEAVGESGAGKEPSAPEAAKSEATPPALPADLASLADSWDSLPEHVRKAIATLARV